MPNAVSSASGIALTSTANRSASIRATGRDSPTSATSRSPAIRSSRSPRSCPRALLTWDSTSSSTSRIAPPQPGGDRGLALDVQAEPVAQPGDRVVIGLVPQRLQQPEVVQRGRDVPAERLQQLQVLVAEPAPPAEPVADLEIAAVPVAGAQRDDQHVPGLAVGQRGQHLRAGTAIGGRPGPAGRPGHGEQRVVLDASAVRRARRPGRSPGCAGALSPSFSRSTATSAFSWSRTCSRTPRQSSMDEPTLVTCRPKLYIRVRSACWRRNRK